MGLKENLELLANENDDYFLNHSEGILFKLPQELIGLSNSVYGDLDGVENSERANKVRRLLGIPLEK